MINVDTKKEVSTFFMWLFIITCATHDNKLMLHLNWQIIVKYLRINRKNIGKQI